MLINDRRLTLAWTGLLMGPESAISIHNVYRDQQSSVANTGMYQTPPQNPLMG